MSRRQLPRGTAAQLDAATFLPGEIAVDTTNDEIRYDGDGSTVGGIAIAKKSAVTALETLTAALGSTPISAAMAPVLQASTLTAAHAALGQTIFPIADYANLQAAIDAAYANGCGTVLVDRDITLSSTAILKNYVVVQIEPGVTITWAGGAAAMFSSASNNVLLHAGISGYGATLAMGTSATKAVEVYGAWHCAFKGFEITGSSATSIALDLRGDASAGANQLGGRHCAYNQYQDILHAGICGTFLRLYGTDANSGYITLNTFTNLGAESCSVRGIDFYAWCDHNQFTGLTRVALYANNAIGVEFNTSSPTTNVGVYANNFENLAVDTFNTYTGRIGVRVNNAKAIRIDYLYQYPLAEGGSVIATTDAGAYSIFHFVELEGIFRLYQKSTDQLGAGRYIDRTDSASVQLLRLEGDRATPAAGDTIYVSYVLSDSAGNQDEFARIAGYAEAVTSGAEVGQMRFYVNVLGTLTGKMILSSTALVPFANDGIALGAGTAAFSDLYLASGAVLNIANGNWIATHTSGVLTIGTGDIRVSTPGSNNASVVTVAGAQTLTNKTLNSPAMVTPALGTPSSGALTNCTGLPISTGVSGLGSGVATFLATPTSANLRAALSDETGSGAAVFATSPTLVTPILGTPASGTLTNCTGLPASTGITGGDGTYTPTLTNVANVDATTPAVCQYLRIGSTVTVSGTLALDATSAGVLTQVGISLPVASDFASVNQCAGTATGDGGSNGPGVIRADATNNRAELYCVPAGATNTTWYFQFTYRII